MNCITKVLVVELKFRQIIRGQEAGKNMEIFIEALKPGRMTGKS